MNQHKTSAELANEIVDIWLDHAFAAHPCTMLEFIREGFAHRSHCAVCDSLHEQLAKIEAQPEPAA